MMEVHVRVMYKRLICSLIVLSDNVGFVCHSGVSNFIFHPPLSLMLSLTVSPPPPPHFTPPLPYMPLAGVIVQIYQSA